VRFGRYLKHEVRRTSRNRKFFLFSLAIPLLLFYVLTGGHGHDRVDGLSAAAYYMISLSGWGAVSAVVAAGTLIAAERHAGWNRQLRLTALRPTGYFTAKAATAYLVAIPTLGALYAAGAGAGVSITTGHWATMTAEVLAGLLPFAALGILLGQLLSVDAMGPALAGVMVVVGLLGGIWNPISTFPAWLQDACRALPAYWLTQAGQAGMGAAGVTWWGWLVLAGWTLLLAGSAGWTFQRSTARG
jgi:ABC-2 type transport system permease protein